MRVLITSRGLVNNPAPLVAKPPSRNSTALAECISELLAAVVVVVVMVVVVPGVIVVVASLVAAPVASAAASEDDVLTIHSARRLMFRR
jgi:hypothetical protein